MDTGQAALTNISDWLNVKPGRLATFRRSINNIRDNYSLRNITGEQFTQNAKGTYERVVPDDSTDGDPAAGVGGADEAAGGRQARSACSGSCQCLSRPIRTDGYL